MSTKLFSEKLEKFKKAVHPLGIHIDIVEDANRSYMLVIDSHKGHLTNNDWQMVWGGFDKFVEGYIREFFPKAKYKDNDEKIVRYDLGTFLDYLKDADFTPKNDE